MASNGHMRGKSFARRLLAWQPNTREVHAKKGVHSPSLLDRSRGYPYKPMTYEGADREGRGVRMILHAVAMWPLTSTHGGRVCILLILI